MSAPELKAAGFNSLVGTLRDMVPRAAYDTFVDDLPPRTRALIVQPPLAMSWISLEDSVPVYTLAFERLFDRKPGKMFELGRAQLRADMTGIYRVFLRIASPRTVAARTAEIYRMYTRHCGTLDVVLDQTGRLDILAEERPFASSAFYHYLRGSVFGVLELTGVKRLAVTIVDGGGELPRCLFRVTWS